MSIGSRQREDRSRVCSDTGFRVFVISHRDYLNGSVEEQTDDKVGDHARQSRLVSYRTSIGKAKTSGFKVLMHSELAH